MFIGLGGLGDITTCGLSFNPTGITPGGNFCFNHSFEGIHTAKVGINWRFGSIFGP